MDPTPRLLPFALVGAFAALVVGGIALSLSSASPFEQQQLHDAAQATMSASGFALTDTNSVSTLGSAGAAPSESKTVVFRILYQAPDAVEETEAGSGGTTMSVILIGDRRFTSNGSTWAQLPPSPGVAAQAVQTILSPFRAAASAATVTKQGAVYRFVPTDSDQFLASVLGVRPSALSSPRLTATLRGDTVASETISALDGPQRLQVDLVFSAIGSSPPVSAPPTSSLVPAPSSSTAPTP